MIQTLGWRSILRYPTRTVQATGHRRCDLERVMKFEPLTENRQVGLQASVSTFART
jgi:hypothetical protein